MKELNPRTSLILWDISLMIGVVLFIFWKLPSNENLIVGFMTVLILTFCIRNHITAYKLNGKIY